MHNNPVHNEMKSNSPGIQARARMILEEQCFIIDQTRAVIYYKYLSAKYVIFNLKHHFRIIDICPAMDRTQM